MECKLPKKDVAHKREGGGQSNTQLTRHSQSYKRMNLKSFKSKLCNLNFDNKNFEKYFQQEKSF